ncbi:allantoate amidohydrolase [Herbaspirillum seropedicae]|uniref:N-carbamoyl-L-amino acid amidohydrolase protein n=1 Tax=Herbaspirillum seropedicae (strain SmR1) TaxID=757424 RepID=D8IWW9_HERSS|nr:allantoate amidohydrolase [Herbaspirillum seropedicae]ADJ66006.1 N-carbamoyl-L-amino acid amidohydrolase protein [Herbaspirillum seropedicae SmR1]AKN67779.1 allantoate amidohydrolase [Herbaspirillum seropedicae]NQE29817.1 allantoate amidohydrolase [Herbaspirillum seropedicae]UMU23808.1 allantoate amidohydrolase [Herbaspirillum seropedicae]
MKAVPEPFQQAGRQAMQWAQQLAQHTESPGMLTRTYLTPQHQAAAAALARWMEEAGMRVRRDNAGNVIGRYEAAPGHESAPSFVTGSHFDTVRNGGWYDGNLGIVLPLACIARWHRQGQRFAFPIEVIGFAEEEGVRFKATLLGSRTVAGTFDQAVLENRDSDGVTMRAAIRAAGLDPDGIAADAWQPGSMAAFVEVHIEQGPLLLNEDLPVGVVTAISGASRFMAEVHGLAGHAGTVPMHLRRDAAMAAAEIGLYIERRCSIKPELVGTMGLLEVVQGAANVVPGLASFSIDIRAEDDSDRLAAVADVKAEIDRIAARRQVQLALRQTHEAASVPCAPRLQAALAQSIAAAGWPVRHLPSGAGHDAMALAGLADVAMLFVRCGNGGISHHPDETMTEADAAIAAQVFSHLVEQFQP